MTLAGVGMDGSYVAPGQYSNFVWAKAMMANARSRTDLLISSLGYLTVRQGGSLGRSLPSGSGLRTAVFMRFKELFILNCSKIDADNFDPVRCDAGLEVLWLGCLRSWRRWRFLRDAAAPASMPTVWPNKYVTPTHC